MKTQKIPKMILESKLTDWLIVVLTLCIVIFTYQQTNVSIKLGEIARLQEDSKILTSKKELRRICFDVMELFSHSGLAERTKHSKEENLELTKNFGYLLQEGFDNYLLVSDKESLRHWINAIQILDFYTFTKDVVWNDKDFDEMFIPNISEAWTEVMIVYQRLGLNLVSMPNQQHKTLKK